MAIYNNNNGTLTTLASGARVWIGTETAFNTAKNSIPNNTAIYITDDGDSPFVYLKLRNYPITTSLTENYIPVSKFGLDNTYILVQGFGTARRTNGTRTVKAMPSVSTYNLDTSNGCLAYLESIDDSEPLETNTEYSLYVDMFFIKRDTFSVVTPA